MNQVSMYLKKPTPKLDIAFFPDFFSFSWAAGHNKVLIIQTEQSETVNVHVHQGSILTFCFTGKQDQ